MQLIIMLAFSIFHFLWHPTIFQSQFSDLKENIPSSLSLEIKGRQDAGIRG